MLSHELRTPLNGVMGPLALLSQSGLSAAQQRLVRQAQLSGRAAVEMLSSLLDYAELQDGGLRIAADPFLLGGLADDIAGPS